MFEFSFVYPKIKRGYSEISNVKHISFSVPIGISLTAGPKWCILELSFIIGFRVKIKEISNE